MSDFLGTVQLLLVVLFTIGVLVGMFLVSHAIRKSRQEGKTLHDRLRDAASSQSLREDLPATHKLLTLVWIAFVVLSLIRLAIAVLPQILR